MIVTRLSPVSGLTHAMDLPVTEQQIIEWQRGALIQDAMPHLSHEQREFVKTGITPEEWQQLFANEWEELDDN